MKLEGCIIPSGLGWVPSGRTKAGEDLYRTPGIDRATGTWSPATRTGRVTGEGQAAGPGHFQFAVQGDRTVTRALADAFARARCKGSASRGRAGCDRLGLALPHRGALHLDRVGLRRA